MTPPLVAGIALCFVSCLGNFGIPAFLGIPGNYLVLPTLIYQRLAGLGPSVLSEVAVLSVLIGVIAVGGIFLQDLMLRRRDFRITTTSNAMRPFELRALAPAGRDRAVDADARRARAAAARAGADVAGAGRRRAADRGRRRRSPTTTTCCSSTRPRSARSSTASACRRRPRSSSCSSPCRSPISWCGAARGCCASLNLVTEMPYALPGVVLAIAAILRVPEAAAAARHVALQHGLDHPVLLPRALPRARTAAGDQRLLPARPHARGSRADRRRAAAATACARSSCRWSRRPRPRARC